jgi:hypothetical protein
MKKEINTVKIFKINNPSEGLADNIENANLSIRFTRGNKMPQYLIMVDESIREEGDCLTARFLVNLKSRLAFVNGTLYNDSLLVIKNAGKEESIDIQTVNEGGEGSYSQALFSFRLIDDGDEQNFLIESWAKSIGGMYGEWIKIEGGIPVAVQTTIKDAKAGKADIFNLVQEPATKTKGNTDATKVSDTSANISVTTGYGSLNIRGATGKKVVVANSSGQIISSEIAGTDNTSLSIPAGIVLVSVDGQPAVKALVK